MVVRGRSRRRDPCGSPASDREAVASRYAQRLLVSQGVSLNSVMSGNWLEKEKYLLGNSTDARYKHCHRGRVVAQYLWADANTTIGGASKANTLRV